MKDKTAEIEKISDQIYNLKNSFNKSTPIIDGIVDQDEYDNCPTKIMWIMKEVNSEDDTNEWDMRGAIKDLKREYGVKKGWASTFNPIVYTTYGILNHKHWGDIPNTYDDPEIIDILHNIAYINVKKVPGSSIAKYGELEQAFREQKEILQKQVELYNPDVIICGGTFYLIRELFDPIEELFSIAPFITYKFKEAIIIDAYHPNQRQMKQELYCDTIIDSVIKSGIKTLNT